VRLIGDLPADEMRTLAGDLARFDAIFTKLAGWPAASNPTPLAIYLFRNRELAARFGLGRHLVGWEMGTLDASFITVEITSGQDEDRSVLFHEYTHVLLARNQRAPIPPWINEGLACYFMTVSERGGAVVLGATPGMFAARLARHGALPLAELFDASIVGMSGDRVADFYATSWALSHYLMSSASGRRELEAFLKQLLQGVPSGEAQTAAFGRSADQLGAELAAHVAQLARGAPIETAIAASAFATSDPPPVVALEPADVAYGLGTLALAMVEVGGAEDEDLEPALARNFLAMATPDDALAAPRSEAAFGEARAVSGDAEGARSAVQSALSRAPDDPRVRLHAARVALLRAEAESASGASSALAEAEDQYVRARTLAPESASAWFGLGQTLVRMGRSDDAFAAFETARRFGWSRQLDIALARLHLARGETAQATDLLRPIAQDPHGGPAQKEAAELLKQAHL
jgi:tetratricopeptide (TPR) repeat protein